MSDDIFTKMADSVVNLDMETAKQLAHQAIDDNLNLLKRYLPYHESDHVLNMAYNVLSGGTCLQDIELLRNDDAWLNAIGAEIIPYPTTAGDFLRRFDEKQICQLMEVKNGIRKKIWEKQDRDGGSRAKAQGGGLLCQISTKG